MESFLVLLLSDDDMFQQLNPGLFTVSISAASQVPGQLIFSPTEVFPFQFTVLMLVCR